MAPSLLPDIAPATYDVIVHPERHLAQKQTNIVFTAGNDTALNWSGFSPGDCNADNIINIQDFAILSVAYAQSMGDPGFIAQADFNCDGIINIVDFAALSVHYATSGDEPGNL